MAYVVIEYGILLSVDNQTIVLVDEVPLSAWS